MTRQTKVASLYFILSLSDLFGKSSGPRLMMIRVVFLPRFLFPKIWEKRKIEESPASLTVHKGNYIPRIFALRNEYHGLPGAGWRENEPLESRIFPNG